MSSAICPYCRGPIESGTSEELLCSGCGTPHHADCYAENNGCTVFGCSAAPADEPKVRLTDIELPSLEQTPQRVKSSPPPSPPGSPVTVITKPPNRTGVIFGTDFEGKKRTTFIILGVLLGPVGAHNFYAGYRGKAVTQLCITLLTLGFGSPMTWIWALIDVWTVDRDSKGIKFCS
jgi:hypothetical protein